MSCLVSYFPLEIYPQIFSLLTVGEIYRFGQVSDTANRILQKLAQEVQEDVNLEGQIEFIKPGSVTAFLLQKLKVEVFFNKDSLPIVSLKRLTLALVSQIATMNLRNGEERTAFLNTLTQVNQALCNKNREIGEESGDIPESLNKDVKELDDLERTLEELKCNFRTQKYSIQCFKPRFTGSIDLVPAAATVRDIKIAAANALGISFESLKIDIQDESYDFHMYDDETTALMKIPMNDDHLICVTVEGIQ